MNTDFLRALLKNEDLETVKKRLNSIEYDRHSEMLDTISRDYRDADIIRKGLQEDENSLAHRFSVEFLKDAQRLEDQKTEELKSFEASRQRIEETYLRKLAEQAEVFKMETDLKRKQICAMEHNFRTRN